MNMKKLLTGFVLVLALLITVASALAAAPTVTLVSPADNEIDSDGSVIFTYNVTDTENNVTICSLYTNIGGIWGETLNDTTISIGTNTFPKSSIPHSVVAWNVLCTDNESLTDWGDSNRTLTIDINNAPAWVTNIPDQPNILEDSGVNSIISDISSYVSDADNDAITFTVQSENATKVDCLIDTNGHNLKLTPATNFFGTSTCTIRATDDHGSSYTKLYADDTFTITVANVQDAPSFTKVIPDQPIVAGTSLPSITLTQYATDVDGETLTFTAVGSDDSKLTASVAGSALTLSAASGVTGTVNVEVTATDGTASANDTFSVTIRGPESKLTLPASLTVGSPTQQRNTNVTGSFDITNSGDSGDSPLTSIRVYFEGSSSYDGDVTFSTSSSGTYASELNISSISVGNKQTVYIRAVIPEDAYGGISTIGNIKVDSAETSGSFELKAQTELKLGLADLDITVSEGDEKNIQDKAEGYLISKDAEPGSEVTVTFKLENTFSSSDDINIDDIEVTINLEDMGDEGDQEESVTIESIDANDESDSETATFTIPYQLDEGEYTLTFEAEGTDNNDAKHRFTKTYKINVAKESYALKFDQSLTPETVTCSGSSDLEVEVFNIGNKDALDIDVEVTNSNLGISLKQSTDKLKYKWDSDGNSEKFVFTINTASNTTAGDYPLTIKVYRNNKKELEGSDMINLKVLACSTPATTTTTPKEDIEVHGTTSSITPDKSTVEITESVETPFLESNTFVILLIAGIAVVVVLIGLLLVMAFRR